MTRRGPLPATRIAAAFALLAAVLACDVHGAQTGGGPAPQDELDGWSCDEIAAISICTDWTRDFLLYRTMGESYLRDDMCRSGTFREGACPAEGRVGMCDLDGTQRTHYYERGEQAYTEEIARQGCTTGYGNDDNRFSTP